MSISRAGERKNKLEELAKLKHEALTELERLGYEVRGKTPAQIREMLSASHRARLSGTRGRL